MTVKTNMLVQVGLALLLSSFNDEAIAESAHLPQAIKHADSAASAMDGKLLAEQAEQANVHVRQSIEHLNQASIHFRDAKDHANQGHLEPAKHSAQQGRIHLDSAK